MVFTRSSDGGESWNRMSNVGFQYAFNSINENIIYAVNGNNVIISNNRGLNWDILKTFAESLGIIKSTPINDKVLFLLTLNNLYRSLDGGNNWDRIL